MSISELSSGPFLRHKRKAAGFKTQRALIQALRAADPTISCSEPYLSLIEKGVKVPSLHLLDVMARVLQLTSAEKGQLLLDYQRVPGDFETTVRANLKASQPPIVLEQLRAAYVSDSGLATLNPLLHALVAVGNYQEAQMLLRQVSLSESSGLEMQIYTAWQAGLAGQRELAWQGFQLALQHCPPERAETRAQLLTNLGILSFERGLSVEYTDLLQALADFLRAEPFLRESLTLQPQHLFARDELARCLYHLADTLQLLAATHADVIADLSVMLPALNDCHTPQAGRDWLQAESLRIFEQARMHYAEVIRQAPQAGFSERALREAVCFYAYLHAKLGLFDQAELLLNSAWILQRSGLICFMQAGLALMVFARQSEPVMLERALEWLKQGLTEEPDTVRLLIQQEKTRELKQLWEQKANELEQLLQSPSA
jgi:hypothetical protein